MTIRPPNNRIALIYGYLVCLGALGFLVTGLSLALPNMIRLMTYRTPRPAAMMQDFDAYKQQHVEQRIQLTRLLRSGRVTMQVVDRLPDLSPEERARLMGIDSNATVFVPLKVSDVMVLPDSVLRANYLEGQMAMEERNRRGTQDNLIAGLQMAFLAAVVFVLHWRWLQGFSEESVPEKKSLVVDEPQGRTELTNT